MNYETSFSDRESLIWCALTAVQSPTVKDPIAYVNRKAKKYGPLLKEAVGLSYNWINTECYAVCVDKVDQALSSKYGWKSCRELRS